MKSISKTLAAFAFIFSSLLASEVHAQTSWSSGRYANSVNEVRTLKVNGASKIRYQLSGETEANYDFVTITDRQGRMLATGSGKLSAIGIADGDQIQVRFTSDRSISAAGFKVLVFDGSPVVGNAINNYAYNAPFGSVAEIPGALAENGYQIASEVMFRWFNGDGSNLRWSMNYVLSNIPRSQGAHDKWKGNLYSMIYDPKMRESLLNSLAREKNSAGKSLLHEGGTFDWISTEISTLKTPNSFQTKEQEENSMNWIAEVGFSENQPYSIPIPGAKPYKLPYIVTNTDAALAIGAGTMRWVPSGKVTISNDGTKATVKVTAMGVYFRDGYDFLDKVGTETQKLGCFRKFPFAVAARSYTQLGTGFDCYTNETFRQWATQNPGRGKDFRIFSDVVSYPSDVGFEWILDIPPDMQRRISCKDTVASRIAETDPRRYGVVRSGGSLWSDFWYVVQTDLADIAVGSDLSSYVRVKNGAWTKISVSLSC